MPARVAGLNMPEAGKLPHSTAQGVNYQASQ
jgi:hypothetical protein